MGALIKIRFYGVNGAKDRFLNFLQRGVIESWMHPDVYFGEINIYVFHVQVSLDILKEKRQSGEKKTTMWLSTSGR